MVTIERKPLPPRLLIRPAPLKGESLRGYLLRVGECNGLGKGTNLFKFLTGSDSRYSKASDHALERVAHSLGLSRDQVEFMSYPPIRTHVDGKCGFFGHTIARFHLRIKRPALCLVCLAEQQAVNGLWDLKAVNVCVRHGTWLIDRCPSCSKAFRWNRERVVRCQCGFDLRAVETNAAPFEVVAQIALIHEVVFQDLPGMDRHFFPYPQWLRQLSLNTLLGFFHYTADVLAPAHPSYESATEAYCKHRHVALVLSEILQDWPNGLWSYLKYFCKRDTADVVLSAEKFNSTYIRVLRAIRMPTAPHFEVPSQLKQAVQQFRADHCIHSPYYFERKRYFNPSRVGHSGNRERVMKFADLIVALDLQEVPQDFRETIPFSTFLSTKLEKLSSGIGRAAAHYPALNATGRDPNGPR